jgi:3-dehydroquinate synthase
MSKIEVQSEKGSYSVTIGRNLISEILPNNSIILADSAVKQYIPAHFDRIIFLDANENTKNLQTCELVIEQLKKLDANRKTNLVAIGGGYVQDISTLVASLFMRGIKWQYIPTTAMAIFDSCIGGKSSINSGNFKNLIGNIYPPTNVLIDLGVTKSLNPIAIACGLSEAIKICYARGHKEFQVFVDLYRDFKNLDSVTGEDLIEHVLKSKQWFIEEDEFDTGIRQLLNFGHTFGHALEAATSFSVPHGIAVSLGMLSALNFDEKLNSQPEINLSMEIWKILQPVKIQVASQVKIFNDQSFKNAFMGDKKHIDSKFRLILSSNGELKIKEIERNSENLEKALIAIQSVMEDLSKNEK